MRTTHRLCGRAGAIILGCFAITDYTSAANRSWTGTTDSEWTKVTNWSNGVPVAGDTAIFSPLAPGASTTPTIETGDVVDLSSILFNPGAPAYQMQVEMGAPGFPASLTLSGGGITNSSSNLQTLNIHAGFAPLPANPNTAWPGGRLLFTNNATVNASGAGVTIVLNSPQVVGIGSITPAIFTLENSSSAGNARINVLADHNGTADGNAFIRFRHTSGAGSAQIDVEGGFNDGGHVFFQDNSSAAGSWISNGAGFPHGAFTSFEDNSIGGFAQISNLGSTGTAFGAGRTFFRDSSSALNANITNYGGNSGNGGSTIFEGTSSAGNATITALGGTSGGAGGITEFKGNSTAATASLISNGSLNVGQGGTTRFIGNANGASADAITNAGAFFDISGLTTTGTTLGSIAGAGDYILGGKNLIVGSNNLSTTVSGIISGNNSTLTKGGAGTLTLSGANTFSGGFVLSQGGVNVNNNTSALGTGVFFIFDGRVGSTNSSAVIPNNVSIGGDFELSPVNNPAAELHFSGGVNLGANLRQLSTVSNGQIRFSNFIAGAGGGGMLLRPIGNVAGSFSFTGSASNTYTSSTSVAGNGTGGTVTLLLGKTGGATAIPASLEIGAGGTVRLLQSDQIANGSSVFVFAGALLDLEGASDQIGSLNGAGAVQLNGASLAGTLGVGTGNFSGVISDGSLAGNLIKSGPSFLVLSGANSYSGTTNVAGGILTAANATGSATGFSAVVVDPGASLAGGNPTGTAGFINGPVLIKDQGILTPGLTPSTAGILTVTTDLALSSDSQILMQLRSPNNFFAPDNDLIKVDDYLTLDGTLQIDTTNGFGGSGDYLLFTHGGLADAGLKIGTPPTGYNASDFSIDLTHPNQVILHVVPEPTALALLLSITSLFPRRRFRKITF